MVCSCVECIWWFLHYSPSLDPDVCVVAMCSVVSVALYWCGVVARRRSPPPKPSFHVVFACVPPAEGEPQSRKRAARQAHCHQGNEAFQQSRAVVACSAITHCLGSYACLCVRGASPSARRRRSTLWTPGCSACSSSSSLAQVCGGAYGRLWCRLVLNVSCVLSVCMCVQLSSRSFVLHPAQASKGIEQGDALACAAHPVLALGCCDMRASPTMR